MGYDGKKTFFSVIAHIDPVLTRRQEDVITSTRMHAYTHIHILSSLYDDTVAGMIDDNNTTVVSSRASSRHQHQDTTCILYMVPAVVLWDPSTIDAEKSSKRLLKCEVMTCPIKQPTTLLCLGFRGGVAEIPCHIPTESEF